MQFRSRSEIESRPLEDCWVYQLLLCLARKTIFLPHGGTVVTSMVVCATICAIPTSSFLKPRNTEQSSWLCSCLLVQVTFSTLPSDLQPNADGGSHQQPSLSLKVLVASGCTHVEKEEPGFNENNDWSSTLMRRSNLLSIKKQQAFAVGGGLGYRQRRQRTADVVVSTDSLGKQKRVCGSDSGYFKENKVLS